MEILNFLADISVGMVYSRYKGKLGQEAFLFRSVPVNLKTIMTSYPYDEFEKKWKSEWKNSRLYEVDIQNASNPFYNLWMFPYPSGARMHIGHAYASTGSDVYGRYMRMKGFDVFQPMGFDAFGIHGENYALKVGEHPWKLMEDLCDRFRDEQFYAIGHGYDWDKEVRTYWPSYYKWTQWFFVQLYNHGLAERKKAEVNWCPSCKTVLSDEQALGGICERCKSTVETKELEQWFFKITKFVDKLAKNLDTIDWSPRIVETQRNWIGRKEGITIVYPVEGTKETISCFTTRPDTNFGATFVVVGPEHALVSQILSGDIPVPNGIKGNISLYVEKAKAKTKEERITEGREKTGVFTGLYAINHLNKKQMPIWISDFVLQGFGTGAIVGVPGHDKRDFEFAKKFDIPITRVVSVNDDKSDITSVEQVQEGEGRMIHSEFLDGMNIHDATEKMMSYLEEKGWGKRSVSYRLRDWLISRQRYWSAPIPIIYCSKCGTVPVPEKDLPVELPYVEDWKPKGDGRGPLANIPEFVHTVCPTCGGPAERETDTIDNFLDSAWYFFRYPFAHRDDVPFAAPGLNKSGDSLPDQEAFKKWFPVHLYLGGAEHAVLHLMYTRFITMALHEMGYMPFDEPFVKFFAHGMIIKDGKKMSKSLGNIVNPDEYITKIGADAFRMYLLFIGPYEQGGDFSDSGLSGMTRFLTKVWTWCDTRQKGSAIESTPNSKTALRKTIRQVTEDIQQFKFNTSIARLMECIRVLTQKGETLSDADAFSYIKLLAPLAPFITEEIAHTHFPKLLEKRKNNVPSIHIESWPEEGVQQEEESYELVIQVNGKLRGVIQARFDETEELLDARAKKTIEKYVQGPITKKIFIKGRCMNYISS